MAGCTEVGMAAAAGRCTERWVWKAAKVDNFAHAIWRGIAGCKSQGLSQHPLYLYTCKFSNSALVSMRMPSITELGCLSKYRPGKQYKLDKVSKSIHCLFRFLRKF